MRTPKPKIKKPTQEEIENWVEKAMFDYKNNPAESIKYEYINFVLYLKQFFMKKRSTNNLTPDEFECIYVAVACHLEFLEHIGLEN